MTSVDTLIAELLAELPTAAEQRGGYDRELSGHWVDADGDGCETREETLIDESTVPVTTGSGCLVTGRWDSHANGVWVEDPSELDVDHLVPLAEAWDSGVDSWDAANRRAFAKDLDGRRSLPEVAASTNRSKADYDPAGWLPAVDDYHCACITDWVVVKRRWQLAVGRSERTALEEVVAG